MTSVPIIISLEGNIGCGKSTLLDVLKQDDTLFVVPEKVDEWMNLKDDHNVDLFQLYYQDKERYSFMFQAYVMMSRIAHMADIIEQHRDKIIVCERCHLSDFYIFVEHLEETQGMSSVEKLVYSQLHQQITRLVDVPIRGVIYNKTDPEICVERIHKRSRHGEEQIQLDFIEKIHRKHEQFIEKLKKEYSDIPILEINGNIETGSMERQHILAQIKGFIEQIKPSV